MTSPHSPYFMNKGRDTNRIDVKPNNNNICVSAPPRKRVLLACPNYYHSPFQVGSHHLAREFVAAGWDVAFVSDAISPWHLARGLTPDLKKRFAIWRAGGQSELAGRLWTYIPAAFATPHGKPIFRSDLVHRHWHQWTWPNVVERVVDQGFGKVDLLYVDSFQQSFWLDAIDYRQAVYRVADYNPHFEKYSRAARRREKELAQRADLVVYPSPQLHDYALDLGARHVLHLPNGVDFDHFAGNPQPIPDEYRSLGRPIAVYVGVMPAWFHFAWVREAARQLPEISFVLIGKPELARQELAHLPNVHILGFRDYGKLPGYLQHADVGLMPFNVAENGRAVDCLNPQKLYEYLACGLPVVSSDWEAIRNLNPPVALCRTAEEFVTQLRQAPLRRANGKSYRDYASGFSWRSRLNYLLEVLGRDQAKQAA